MEKEVYIVLRGNHITPQMKIEGQVQEALTPIITNSQTPIGSEVFPAEIDTTTCTNGIIFQFRLHSVLSGQSVEEESQKGFYKGV